MKKKLLLIQPSPYDQNRKPVKKNRLYFVGLAMPLLAALTPEDWEVEICLETIEAIPFDTDAGLIAIGTMGHGVLRSIDIAKKFRALGKKVVLGGYMASIMGKEAKKYCDAVAIGDSEGYWQELLQDYCMNDLKPFYEQPLDTLETPMPRFDLIMDKRIGDFLPVQAGRGCPKRCSFCSIACLYKSRYLKRDTASVLRDIQQVKDLGFKKFMLLDDHIAADRDYLMDLCSQMKPLNMQWMSQCAIEVGNDDKLLNAMAESGCFALSFGLESITEESLLAMNKAWAKPQQYSGLIRNIRHHGIDVSTEMVVGADGDTIESIEETFHFIEREKIAVPRFYILTPIPGTEFFDKMNRTERLIDDDIYSYDGTRAVHLPLKMTPEELTDSYWNLYNRLFSWGSILRRNVLRREFLSHPLKSLFYVVINLYYRDNIKKGITPNIF